MAYKHYSRKKNVEDRNSTKKAYRYIFISGVLVVALLLFGIPLLTNLAVFTSGFRSVDEVALSGDDTPPPPPTVFDLPSHTSEPKLEMKGETEEGAVVTVNLGSSQKEVLANKDGEFSMSLTLSEGENLFTLKAKDTSGNTSQTSQDYVVILDSEDPDLTITSPQATSFYGSAERQIQIQGETELGVVITINDRLVVVDPNGKFSFSTSLVDGENKFTIKAVDQAGNETVSELTLTFTP